MKIYIRTPKILDLTYIKLVNGLNSNYDPNVCGVTPSRSYNIPSSTGSQQVIYHTSRQLLNLNHAPTWTYLEFCFTAQDNYSQLWFYVEDDNNTVDPNTFTSEDAPSFQFNIVDIECCPANITYYETAMYKYPGVDFREHDRLPIFSHAKNSITAIPTKGNINVLPNESVTFKAGTEIVLKASGSQHINIKPGSNFLAKIEPCDCSNSVELCDNIVPDDPNFRELSWPNALDPQSPNSYQRLWYLQDNGKYPIPFNATEGYLEIKDYWGGRIQYTPLSQICTNQEEPGKFIWNGCWFKYAVNDYVQLPADTYRGTLYLKNCYTSKTFNFTIDLLSVNQNCVASSLVGDDSSLSSVFKKAPNNTYYLEISPNPSSNNGNIQISVNIPDDSPAKLSIYSIDGRQLETNSKIHSISKGFQTINYPIAGLQKGIYIFTLTHGNGRINKKVIVQ